MKNTIIVGITLIILAMLGLVYPVIVMQTYTPYRELRFRSLVKTIYNSIIENIVVKLDKTVTLSLNDTVLSLKIRSSILRASSYDGGNIRIVLTPLANVPSDYIILDEDGVKTIIIIGYFIELYMPEKMDYFELDGKLSYISITFDSTVYRYFKASLLGSIVELMVNNSRVDTIIMRLDESLMESYIDLSSLNFTGELSVELEPYTSIVYSHINVSNDTRIRVIRENIGGVEEVSIDGSRLYEYYYIDPGYYESEKRLHVAVRAFGSGVRIDISRIS